MNKMPTKSNNADTAVARAATLKSGHHNDDQHSNLHHAMVISRIFYAVFIIGFMGYYLDRAMEILKN
jgi:hypothetical protein